MLTKKELVDIDATRLHATDDAILLDHGGDDPAWVPKSLVVDNDDGTFTMPEWLAMKKGMI